MSRRVFVVLWVILSVSAAWGQKDGLDPSVDPDFRPTLVDIDFTARTVRPGDVVGVTYSFGNEGTSEAKDDYMVFVHFEGPDKTCSQICIHADHLPTIPTSAWLPEQVVADGPHVQWIPEDILEGSYHVHVGVYAHNRDGARLLDTYEAGSLMVSRTAPPSSAQSPPVLEPSVLRSRAHTLSRRVLSPVSLETSTYSFSLDRREGIFELRDSRTDVLWASNPFQETLGAVKLVREGKSVWVSINAFDQLSRRGKSLRGMAILLGKEGKTLGILKVQYAHDSGTGALRVTFQVDGENGWMPDQVRLLEKALWCTDVEQGETVLPIRMGELMRAKTVLPCTRRLLTYNSISMAMAGVTKSGSGLLLTWDDPDGELIAQALWPDEELVPGQRMVSLTLTLPADANGFSILPLGEASYVDVGKAYRPFAKRNGWLKTWQEKSKRFPSVEEIHGAADFKPFVFSRTVTSSRFNDGNEDRLSLSYTFEEAARCAEHFHDDLEIDKAMYVLAGWLHRGYDNQHPDILPAAPECGGTDGLVDCSQRIRNLGYLFGLHDNYQDMYEDAPSWNVDYLNKNHKGDPKQGGNWAGGQAWQVCAIEQVNLAAREGNLPEVKKLFSPSIYFIDTVFAWGLVTCEDPAHLMTRSDDLLHKSRLCELAKDHFGLFGSEEGREWAIPCSDYLEGIFSHKVAKGAEARLNPHLEGIPIPLFEVVYGDCVNLYTHQGDRATPSRPGYILDHLLCAEMPVYAFGTHLYFEDSSRLRRVAKPEVTSFAQINDKAFEISFRWVVEEDMSADARAFLHFTHPSGDKKREMIAFQADHDFDPPTSTWRKGDVIVDGPHRVGIPDTVSGSCSILIGLTGESGRIPLKGRSVGSDRYDLGRIEVTENKIELVDRVGGDDPFSFSRGDHGWAKSLNETDRFIKNTYEVLSPLQQRTAHTPMTDHRFLREDLSAEYSAFGDTHIYVNHGTEPLQVDLPAPWPKMTLPRWGFLVWDPTFLAFHASKIDGTTYEPTVFSVLQSLDEKPLPDSKEIHRYHGFGTSNLNLFGGN